MKLEFAWQIFEKYSNIKFHENASSGGRVVAFHNFDDESKKHTYRNILRLGVGRRIVYFICNAVDRHFFKTKAAY
jgi:adenosine/AMP kinase